MAEKTVFRPMLRAKQEIPKEECVNLLVSEKRGVLSVLGDNGYPYGMPMDHWYCLEDGKLYFHGSKTGHKIDAIRRCDKASYCVIDDGYRQNGEWPLNFKSVIVFGRIEIIEDQKRVVEICRNLSYKFLSDEAYIQMEIKHSALRTLCFALTPEHISGKRVNES